nr:hypothetical protein [Rhabdothermincola sediminis]
MIGIRAPFEVMCPSTIRTPPTSILGPQQGASRIVTCPTARVTVTLVEPAATPVTITSKVSPAPSVIVSARIGTFTAALVPFLGIVTVPVSGPVKSRPGVAAGGLPPRIS